MTPRYVRIPRFCELTGYSEKATRRKMEEGHWRVNEHYIRAGREILMDLEGYEQWVEQHREHRAA